MTGRCKDRNWTDNGVTSVKSSDLGPISRKKHQLSIVKKKQLFIFSIMMNFDCTYFGIGSNHIIYLSMLHPLHR